jgi:hypothetical protein
MQNHAAPKTNHVQEDKKNMCRTELNWGAAGGDGGI